MRILAVDDSVTMLRIISNTLRRLGYGEVEQASNGQEALARLQAGGIEFVITDWNMPEMDGLQLVKAMRSKPALKDIPVLMVTARGVKEDILKAVKAGACSYIVKPFTPQTLQEKIQRVVC